MSPVSISVFPVVEVVPRAAEMVRNHLKHLLTSKTPTLLLLSGGSNIEVAREALLPLHQNEPLFSSLITLLPLDERFSADPDVNNSLLLRKVGLPVLKTVPKLGESLEAFSRRYAEYIQAWRQRHPHGKIVATIGMGTDGHVAGISPFPEDPHTFNRLFIDTSDQVVGYRGKLQPPERVTVSPSFLQQIDFMVATITGSEKRTALEAFIAEKSPPHLHPIQVLHAARGELHLFTDQEV